MQYTYKAIKYSTTTKTKQLHFHLQWGQKNDLTLETRHIQHYIPYPTKPQQNHWFTECTVSFYASTPSKKKRLKVWSQGKARACWLRTLSEQSNHSLLRALPWDTSQHLRTPRGLKSFWRSFIKRLFARLLWFSLDFSSLCKRKHLAPRHELCLILAKRCWAVASNKELQRWSV